MGISQQEWESDLSSLTFFHSVFPYSAYHNPVISLPGGKARALLERPQEGALLPTVYWGALPSGVWPLNAEEPARRFKKVQEEPARRPSLASLLGNASIAQKSLSPNGLLSRELLNHISSNHHSI